MTQPTATTVQEQILEGETVDGPMAILHKRPDDGRSYPSVVMFHDGPGVRSATHEFAAKLARSGFEVYVPDLYHRHGRLIGYELAERQADPSLVDHLWTMLGSLTDAGVQQDLDEALTHINAAEDEPIGCIGFCVGARATFRTMMRFPGRFPVGAMWHPSYLADEQPDSPHLSADGFAGHLFIGVGDSDEVQPIEANQPFFDHVQDLPHVDLQIFVDTDHAYTWPGWPRYNQTAAEESFTRTVQLFRDNLEP